MNEIEGWKYGLPPYHDGWQEYYETKIVDGKYYHRLREAAHIPTPAQDAPETERTAFEAVWAKRQWLTAEETDKDLAWRWWQARAAQQPPVAPVETDADLPTAQDVRGILPRSSAGSEPVAWMYEKMTIFDDWDDQFVFQRKRPNPNPRIRDIRPLYLHPPQTVSDTDWQLVAAQRGVDLGIIETALTEIDEYRPPRDCDDPYSNIAGFAMKRVRLALQELAASRTPSSLSRPHGGRE